MKIPLILGIIAYLLLSFFFCFWMDWVCEHCGNWGEFGRLTRARKIRNIFKIFKMKSITAREKWSVDENFLFSDTISGIFWEKLDTAFLWYLGKENLKILSYCICSLFFIFFLTVLGFWGLSPSPQFETIYSKK